MCHTVLFWSPRFDGQGLKSERKHLIDSSPVEAQFTVALKIRLHIFMRDTQ